MNFDIAIKRLDQFEKINAYALDQLRHMCFMSNRRIVQTGEIDTFKMGRTGVFVLTQADKSAKRYIEMSFDIEDDQDGNVIWYPQHPHIRLY